MLTPFLLGMRKSVVLLALLLMPVIVQAYCGDGVCNVAAGETRNTCCADCPCGFAMDCSDDGVCVFPEAPVQITGGAITHLYGFEGAFAAMVAGVAITVIVLYKLRK